MAKKIAITGGIGSGKSTVCNLLKQEGCDVFSCDEIYRELIRDPAYIQKIAATFPDCIVNEKIDKKLLAKNVFLDSEKRAQLNAIAHPLIMQALFEKMETCKKTCFAEVPLLFEGNYQNLFDDILIVTRPKQDRIQAVVNRDNLTQQEVENRIAAQLDYNDESFLKKYSVISNDGNLEKLKLSLLNYLKNL